MLRAVGAPEPFDPSWPPLDLQPSVPAATGARQVHQALLEIIIRNEPGVRAALDSEFLHDFRVAIRRTRSLLRQIRNVFPDDAVEHFSSEFSWIGRLTGPSRDMDVLVLALCQRRLDVPGDDVAAVISCLQMAQQDEHRKLVDALDSDRYRQLLSEWQAFLRGPSASEIVPAQRTRSPRRRGVAPSLALVRRIVRSSRDINGATAPAELHEVRIAAKKLRYLVDISPSFYQAKDLERILSALKSLQRVLGDFNDAHVQERRLLECGHAAGAAGGPAGAILTLGRLAEQTPPARRGPARGGARRTGPLLRARRTLGLQARIQEGSRCRRRTMSVIAVYNMKGGVGKTTTAINLSYLCAAAGQRTLLWDLDPQAASSFAFRIRPHVEGFQEERRGARTCLRGRHQAVRLRRPRSAAGRFRLSQAGPAARSPRQSGARGERSARRHWRAATTPWCSTARRACRS